VNEGHDLFCDCLDCLVGIRAESAPQRREGPAARHVPLESRGAVVFDGLPDDALEELESEAAE
jgi:hypothetical protein